MNLATLLILGLVLLAVLLALYLIYKGKVASCVGTCEGCSLRKICGRKR